MKNITETEAARLVIRPDGRQSPVAADIMRGAQRMFRRMGHSAVTELALVNGRRADIVALSPDGSLTIVEVKSSAADFRADTKWRDYLEYCDRFFFAIDSHTPAEIIPLEVGLVVADRYEAAIVREAPLNRAHGSRRRATLLSFARCAADRLHSASDPEFDALNRTR